MRDLDGDVIRLAPLVDLLRQVRRSSLEALTDQTRSPARFLDLAGGDPAGPGGLFGPVLDLIRRLAGEGAVVVGFEF